MVAQRPTSQKHFPDVARTATASNAATHWRTRAQRVFSNFAAPADGDAATFSVSAIANPGNTPKVEASFVDELTKTLRDGFTAEELATAKKAIHDTRVGGRSSDAGLLNVIAAREQYGRTLDWDQQLDAKLEALTLDQVNAAFRRHINAADISIVKGGDFKAAGVYQ